MCRYETDIVCQYSPINHVNPLKIYRPYKRCVAYVKYILHISSPHGTNTLAQTHSLHSHIFIRLNGIFIDILNGHTQCELLPERQIRQSLQTSLHLFSFVISFVPIPVHSFPWSLLIFYALYLLSFHPLPQYTASFYRRWSDSHSDIYNNSLCIYEIWLNETRFAY